MMTLTFHDKKESFTFKLVKGRRMVGKCFKKISNTKIYNYQEVKADFESFGRF
jgi:hypothetical protein